MHGEAPPDPEAGWGALHSLGLGVSAARTRPRSSSARRSPPWSGSSTGPAWPACSRCIPIGRARSRRSRPLCPDRSSLPAAPASRRLLAPFRAVEPALTVVIEGADGLRVAGTAPDPVPADGIGDRSRPAPWPRGRVVAWGPLAGHGAGDRRRGSIGGALRDRPHRAQRGIATPRPARRIEQELALGRRAPAQLRRPRGARDPGLRPGLPLRGRRTRSVATSSTCSGLVRRGRPLSNGRRRRDRQGHRGGPADGLRPPVDPRRDRQHDRPGRRTRADQPRSLSRSDAPRCSSPPCARP